MNLRQACSLYVTDMRAEGRLTSHASEAAYWNVLMAHAEDVGNRDPRSTGRDDVKRTLHRWPNPNTQRTRRAILVSFYDWAMEEGYRKDNPARQTRRPKARPTSVYRLTLDEAASMLAACRTTLEHRAIGIGLGAGLRSAELRGLRGSNLQRDGWIHVSADIAKGGRPRWVPVVSELIPLIEHLAEHVGPDEHVLHGQRVVGRPGVDRHYEAAPERPMGHGTLYRMVGEVATRAGIKANVHPHLMRHAYGDHVARAHGLQIARELMGHADVSTTQVYVGKPTLDELAAAVRQTSYQTPPAPGPEIAAVPPRGFEPLDSPAIGPAEQDENTSPSEDPHA